MSAIFSEHALKQRQAVDALERAAKLLREIEDQHPDTRDALRVVWAQVKGCEGRVRDLLVR